MDTNADKTNPFEPAPTPGNPNPAPFEIHTTPTHRVTEILQSQSHLTDGHLEAGDTMPVKNHRTGIARVLFDPTFMILVGAIVGFCLGYGLSDGRGSEELVSWVALPGDLFLRALKCVVLPLVFVNIILAIIEMMDVGKAVTIGWKTVALYTLTTLFAAIEGLVCVLIFKTWFSQKDGDAKDTSKLLQFSCPSDPTSFLYEDTNGSLVCLAKGENGFNETFTKFTATDVNEVFQFKSSGVADDISISQTVQDGIFRKAIPSNIFMDLNNGNFVGVIVFAIFFAVASQTRPRGTKQGKLKLVEILEELNAIFLVLINWVIALTPLAVISLIAGALGSKSDLGKVFSDISIVVAATLTAMSFHLFVVYPTIFFVAVKKSPLGYLKHLFQAQTFAFASASSAATLPVTLQCVKNSKEVPDSVANFVLSLGATINMDGGGIYFSIAVVFLAVSTGLEDKLDGVAYFLIILLSTIGSAGTAPVPSASLVLIITAFNTVFDTTGTPDTFSYILAIDWFMDRCRTTLNVTGDAIMARVVTALAGVDVLEVNDQERLSSVSQTIDEQLTQKRSIFENRE